MPVAVAPVMPVFMPVFSIPRYISRLPPTDEFMYKPWAWFPDYANEKDRMSIVNTPGSNEIFGLDVKLNPVATMKLAAKIAHCFSQTIPDEPVSSLLPDYILGKNKYIHNVVGSSIDALRLDQPREVGWMAEDGIYDAGDKRFYTVKVELLRYLYAGSPFGRLPPYWVVVCEASESLAEKILDRDVRRGY